MELEYAYKRLEKLALLSANFLHGLISSTTTHICGNIHINIFLLASSGLFPAVFISSSYVKLAARTCILGPSHISNVP
jgi:hypothetical protein